jgi:hypothetical protein
MVEKLVIQEILRRAVVEGPIEVYKVGYFFNQDHFGVNTKKLVIEARNQAHAVVLLRNYLFEHTRTPLSPLGPTFDLFDCISDIIYDQDPCDIKTLTNIVIENEFTNDTMWLKKKDNSDDIIVR